MSTLSDRLREERKRLGLNQTELAAVGGVQKGAQVNYEAGERAPNADYLAALAAAGADIRYIVTGQRDGPAPVVLTAEEQLLLGYFRDASRELRKAALGVLLSGTTGSGHNISQVNTAPDAILVRGSGNTVLSHRKK